MSFRSFLKGYHGELLNRLGARVLLSRKHYHSFHNIVIPSGTNTTEIDHVVVSRFGVFVIETKHWSGWIFGGERDAHWTLVHFRHKRQVRNPLRQNYGHTMALSALLGIAPALLHPLVAIRGAAFKTPVPEGVVLGGYARHVRRLQMPLLDDGQVVRVLAVLRSDRVGRGWFARVRHAIRTRLRH